MSDPLTNSLLDSTDERKGSTTYSLYRDDSSAGDSALYKRLCASRRHLIILTAISVIIVLAILIPFVASVAGKGEPVPPSDVSSSTGMGPSPPSDASTGAAGPLYTANLTIAGMRATQHGTGSHVIITMPNVFGISVALYNLSITYALAGYRSYAMDIVYGDPMPGNSPPDWWARHLYNDTVAHMQRVVDEIRADPTVETLQAIGFCYGGGVALGMLAMERPVHAAVSAHPTWWNNGVWTLGHLEQRINGSVFLIVPTRDEFNLYSADWITTLAYRNLDAEFTIYPHTGHGQTASTHRPRCRALRIICCCCSAHLCCAVCVWVCAMRVQASRSTCRGSRVRSPTCAPSPSEIPSTGSASTTTDADISLQAEADTRPAPDMLQLDRRWTRERRGRGSDTVAGPPNPVMIHQLCSCTQRCSVLCMPHSPHTTLTARTS